MSAPTPERHRGLLGRVVQAESKIRDRVDRGAGALARGVKAGVSRLLPRPALPTVPVGAFDPARAWRLATVPANGHAYAPVLRDALDRNPDQTVAYARELYLKALGVAPQDQSGRVLRMRRIYIVLAGEAERRRLARVDEADRRRLERLAKLKHGPLRDLFRNIGVRAHILPEAPPSCPSAADEDALNEGEWIEWADAWRQAWRDEEDDHLLSVLPRLAGESYPRWRARARLTQGTWDLNYVREQIESAVRASQPTQSPSARLPSRGSRSRVSRHR